MRFSALAEPVVDTSAAKATWLSSRKWSKEQLAIFKWFETKRKKAITHLVVRARAGTGKTTTLLACVDFAWESSILVTSFSGRITKELQRRLKSPKAVAQGLHSLGNSFVTEQWGAHKVDKWARGKGVTAQVCTATKGDRPAKYAIVPFEVQKLITKLHEKGRELKPHATTPAELEELLYRFDCDLDPQVFGPQHELWQNAFILDMAVKAMAHAAEGMTDGCIDFADMIFLPLRNAWVRPKFDLVICDEAQDTSEPQLELAMKACNGRFCLFGDNRQAIFAFRGADSHALDRLKQTLSADELGLKTTYRCAQAIVRLAQEFVPDIVAAKTNPEGEIRVANALPLENWLHEATPGDFILSRLNAPLTSFALKLLKRGVRARVAGKDLGAGLTTLVKTLATKSRDLSQFAVNLRTWQLAQVDYARSQDRADKVERINDQVEMLMAVVESAEDLNDLLDRITVLFVDEDEDHPDTVICSSIHKAKGLETDRVFVYLPSFKFKGQEEENIEYVAITRAKSTLVLVGAKPEPTKGWA
jgi:superfamily I DNA/RNA helicase